MCDFEVAVINAATEVIGADHVRCCFFHLCQSVYRHIQSEGLQELYNDANDRSIKVGPHMLCALPFVPVDQINQHFEKLRLHLPPADYFDETYILIFLR